MTLLDLLVDFARTGRLGPLHCGMPLAEAEELLGPGHPHPAIRMKGPDIDGYPYTWGGLSLDVTRRAVSSIGLFFCPGSTIEIPAPVLPAAGPVAATVAREELIAAFDAAGCRHAVRGVLTFGRQSCVVTQPAEVSSVFVLPGRNDPVPDRERHYLRAMNTHRIPTEPVDAALG
ncbi:hypothetical protein ABT112_30200 [Streptomyces sp. NPDC002055]|uniref:hypothetical protein n=1 Tax=Streptomyces sp. NPDC002055 TaxID=3154534 RepID=UPI0033171D3B